MEPTDKYTEAKDEALRRIGRNVLLFQQVEHQLKFLLRRGSFSGSLSNLKLLMATGDKQVDKRTMGQLIAPLIENHLNPDKPDFVPPAGLTETHISFNFSIKHTSEQVAAFQKQLKSLADERNNLVHHSLTYYKFDSIEACLATGIGLEEQRERITVVRSKLAEMIKILVETNIEFAEQLKLHREEILEPRP